MIIGADSREAVIDNIRVALADGDHTRKVEIGDPVLTPAQSAALVQGWLSRRGTVAHRCKALAARRFVGLATRVLNRDTVYEGLDIARAVTGGALITSNHFGPLENTAIRKLVWQLGKRRLYVVSQETNFAMGGPIGFLMNYADTVPLAEEPHYITRDVPRVLGELTDAGQYVLIYPEQEMWFHYRKPRRCKRGAYLFAAKLGVPIISCFVGMTDLPKHDTGHFSKVRYTVRVLGVLTPDPTKNAKQNSVDMCEQDMALKRAAYEAFYGKPLTYDFSPDDIAGWHP